MGFGFPAEAEVEGALPAEPAAAEVAQDKEHDEDNHDDADDIFHRVETPAQILRRARRWGSNQRRSASRVTIHPPYHVDRTTELVGVVQSERDRCPLLTEEERRTAVTEEPTTSIEIGRLTTSVVPAPPLVQLIGGSGPNARADARAAWRCRNST